MKKIGFMINRYDHEGDIMDKAIFININEDIIIRFDDLKKLKQFKKDIGLCIKEIEEN